MSWDGYIEQNKQHVMELIFKEQTHPSNLRPVSLTYEECRFFNYWNNAFDGWFCEILYHDGVRELWLVVMGVDDDETDDWYIERVKV